MKSPPKAIVIVLIVSLVGSVLAIWGGSWDITSHLLQEPESFFTPPHAVLYTGVGIGLVAGIAALAMLVKDREIRNASFSLGLKLMIVGSVLQIIAGPGDYAWHELFGVDGLLSPTHLTLITGILIQSVGIVIGLTRLIPFNVKVVKPATVAAFSSLWFIVIDFIFQFTLPISNGEMMDFNPDPYVAGIILAVTMPFFSVLIFWGAAKSMGKFGWASAVTGLFIVFNITANIIPSESLWMYLPWYVLPMVAAIVSDGIINNKIRMGRFGEYAAGGLMGSVSLVCSMPLVGMAYVQFYVFSGVTGYELLPDFSGTLMMIFGIMAIPGMVFGVVATKIAKNKISIPVVSSV
ncbi:hypothetical protein K0U27_02590 [archaeon]|nr:hypothetical protein [archaeon]